MKNILEIQKYNISDSGLAPQGRNEIDLARNDMPGLVALQEKYSSSKPLAGARIAGSLHLTAQTAVLIQTLIVMGANVRWSGCNIFSTQDEVAAALAAEGIPVFGYKGESEADYWSFLYQSLSWEDEQANLMLDDGGDLLHLLLYGAMYEKAHNWKWDNSSEVSAELRTQIEQVVKLDGNWHRSRITLLIGASEETTTGIIRLNQWQKKYPLPFPVIDVNNSATKSKFDNLYGSRESLIDGIRRALGMMLAGKTVTVCGYGDVGKGCALALRALGCRVIVTEIDPICALQASMEGYQVLTAANALPITDIVVTATGCIMAISKEDMNFMKDGVVLCNMGHFDSEIEVSALDTTTKTELAPQVARYIYNGKSIILLAEGRLVNLGCAKGHPSFVMSCSFTNQTLAQLELFTKREAYTNSVHLLSKKLDEEVARLHLASLGVQLTTLTPKQERYLGISSDGPYKPDRYRY